MRARLAGTAAVGAVFVIGAVVLASQALRVHTFQDDEFVYLSQGREIARRFPEALWDAGVFHLGVERFASLLQAGAIALFPPASSFSVGKAAVAVVFASVAIPAWLLARGAGAGRVAAVAAAAASVALPWVVLATSFLNEPVAYPVLVWAVWGIMRAATRPSAGNDLLAIVLVAAAGLARSSLVVVAAALPLTILVHELRFGPARRDGLPASLRDTVARHRLLALAVGAGVIWLVAFGGADRVSGTYPVSGLPGLDQVGEKGQLMGITLAEGLGLVPFVLAIAWIASTLAQPGSPGPHALAVATLSVAAVIVYATAAVSAHNEERYVFYLAPLIAIAAIVGLAKRELTPAPVAIAGVLTALLVLTAELIPATGAYDYFAFPAQSFHARVLVDRISELPGPVGSSPEAFLVLVAAGIAVAIVAAARRRDRVGRVVVPVAVTGFLAFGVTVGAYSLTNYIDGAGDPQAAGFGPRTFLDRAFGRDASYSHLDGQSTATEPAIWRELKFFNASFSPALYLGYDNYMAAVSRRTGTLDPTAPTSPPFPPLVVTIPQYRPVGMAGRLVEQADYLHRPVGVYRLDEPQQARWFVLDGVEPGGRLPAGTPARIRVWGAGLRPVGGARCLVLQLAAAADAARVRTRTGRGTARMELRAGAASRFAVPLGRFDGQDRVDAVLESNAQLQLGRMAVRRCDG